MLFHMFASKKERIERFGSDLIELQFCRFPSETSLGELVNNALHWQDDSLYINDESLFYNEYSEIFNCGIYNNLSCGVVDLYGLNYYSPDVTETIIEKIKKHKPTEYEIVLDWLIKAKEYNGFYILGI